jgi:hypothetical protein
MDDCRPLSVLVDISVRCFLYFGLRGLSLLSVDPFPSSSGLQSCFKAYSAETLDRPCKYGGHLRADACCVSVARPSRRPIDFSVRPRR